MEDEPQRSGEGSPLWMTTFADMVTLMMAFFVLLLSFANMDMVKYRGLVESLEESFGAEKTHEGKEEVFSTTFVKLSDQESSTSIKVQDLNLNARDKALKTQMLSRLRGFVSDKRLEKTMKVEDTAEGILVRVQGDVMFDPGDAELRPEALVILRELADLTERYPYPLAIEGHTDDLPVTSKRFESNWELSAARAIAALRFLTESGEVSPGRLSVAGYAHTKPLVRNLSPEHRARNRRVEFLFHNRPDRRLEERATEEAAPTPSQEGPARSVQP